MVFIEIVPVFCVASTSLRKVYVSEAMFSKPVVTQTLKLVF